MIGCTATAAANPLGLSDGTYKKMMDASLMSTGNNYRTKAFLQKLKSGKDVYVACIGGSVTEGAGPASYTDGYAYQFVKALNDTYAPKGKNCVHSIIAGLSGSPSAIGIVRYEQDVIAELGTSPDLLVIEFSVNDYMEPTKVRGFEKLIRNVLETKSDAMVIALYAAAQYGNVQNDMKPVADHYQIPQVSILDAVKPENRNGEFTDKEYYTDNVHPFMGGHEIMRDCLMNMLAVCDNAKADEKVSVPAAYKNQPCFNEIKMISNDFSDANVKIISKGSFDKVDSQTQGLKRSARGAFPNNFYHPMGSTSNEALKMEVTCRGLVFVYKQNGGWTGQVYGKADVYVDGKKAATYDGGQPGGWNNCLVQMVLDETEVKKHTIEVKMADGDEKKGFTICAMAYTK